MISFFKNTIFLVDGLHYPGHVNCSPSYNFSKYRVFQNLVSVFAETQNSLVGRRKGHLMFMNSSNFVLFLKYLLYCMVRNWKQKNK